MSLRKEEQESANNKLVTLDDDVNTSDWKCLVVVTVEKNGDSYKLVDEFVKKSKLNQRPSIKVITYQDIIDLIYCVKNDLDKAECLFFKNNFKYMFENISRYSDDDDIPTQLMSLLIKSYLLFLKQEDVIHKNIKTQDLITVMKNKPSGFKNVNQEKSKEKVVGKSSRSQSVDSKGTKKFTTKDPSRVKEDTKLWRRGEVRKFDVIDDKPKDGFQLYIILTGFYDPKLILELIWNGVPLYGVLCIDGVSSNMENNYLSNNMSAELFWTSFLKILWSRELIRYFKNIVFQVFRPENIPTSSDESSRYIYDEISRIVYDLPDILRQHENYLRHLNVIDVRDVRQNVNVPQKFDAPFYIDQVSVVVENLVQVCEGNDSYQEKLFLEEDFVGEEVVLLTFTSPKVFISEKFLELEEKYELLTNRNQDVKKFSLSETNASTYDAVYLLWKRFVPEHVQHSTIIKQCFEYSIYLQIMMKLVELIDRRKISVSVSHDLSYQSKLTISDSTNQPLTKRTKIKSDYYVVDDVKIVSGLMRKAYFNNDVSSEGAANSSKQFDEFATDLGKKNVRTGNEFDFVEVLDKTKMRRALKTARNDYSCLDHMYSPLTDCLFLVFHDETNENSLCRETFSETLRTPVCVKDFYDNVIDEEKKWIDEEEAKYKERQTLDTEANLTSHENNTLYNPTTTNRHFEDCDFWLEGSLKYGTLQQTLPIKQIILDENEVNNEKKISEQNLRMESDDFKFESYNVDELSVKFSGFRTTYQCRGNNSVTVELLERLYDRQHLKLKVKFGGNELYVYTEVCPVPHVEEPFLFHIRLQDDIFIVFNRNSSSEEYDNDYVGEEYCYDEFKNEFAYEMRVSLPTGLVLSVVSGVLSPCYIKQEYAGEKSEQKLCFLSDGSLVKFFKGGQIQFLSVSTMLSESSICSLDFVDIDSGAIYSRRSDGVCFAHLPDGTLIIEHPSGSKLTCYSYLDDTRENDFVFVQTRIVFEGDDYLTLTFDSCAQKWNVLLPFNIRVDVEPNGFYKVNTNDGTHVQVTDSHITMSHFDGGNLTTVVDLSRFNDHPFVPTIYATTTDGFGNEFCVETDGHCYCRESYSQTDEVDSTRSSIVRPKHEMSKKSRYFVLKSDFTGFEFLHTDTVKKHLEKPKCKETVFTQRLANNLKYFVLISSSKNEDLVERWKVPINTPSAKFQKSKTSSRSVYDDFPPGTRPFQKKIKKKPCESKLTCRVFVETNASSIHLPKPKKKKLGEILSNIPVETREIQKYLLKIANNDLTLLTEMLRSMSVCSGDGMKQESSNGDDSDQTSFSDSKCDIPNFFQHPLGFIFLLLNDIIDGSHPGKKILGENTSNVNRHQARGRLRSQTVMSSSCVTDVEKSRSEPVLKHFPYDTVKSEFAGATGQKLDYMDGDFYSNLEDHELSDHEFRYNLNLEQIPVVYPTASSDSNLTDCKFTSKDLIELKKD